MILDFAAVVLLVVAFVCILFGVPLYLINIVRMTRHAKKAPHGWHDWWGLNRNNLLFFPAMLDEAGRRYRTLALQGLRIGLVGLIAGIIGMARLKSLDAFFPA